MREFDFVIVGSGIAGLSVALKAAAHGRVAIITKRRGKDSNTRWAQGGIACVMSPEDSINQHVEDTLDAGAGLCKEPVVRTMLAEGPLRIQELIAAGVEFDRREKDGEWEFDLGKEGGHSRRRVLHTADTTGKEISRKLLAAIRAHPDIVLLEQHFAIDLITSRKLGAASEDRTLGLYVLDEITHEVLTIRCPRVVLCTGGCGRVYQFTTNPDVATGDGVAMAWRAGAAISNLEFIQFHPTCLFHPEEKSFLVSEALRGEGAELLGADGEPFMQEYDSRGSLAPRDIVARAIDREIKRTGAPCVFLDISHKGRDFISARFPHIYETCMRLGIDPATSPIPVVPAAHYQCGGVETTIDGLTSLPGLYAVGEVACTGLHGANRLASNSLLEGVVVAHRAVAHMLEHSPPGAQDSSLPHAIPEWESGDAEDVDELVVIYHNWDEIRRLMWDYVSIVRTTKRLRRAATRLQNLRREVHEFYWNFRLTPELLELRNLVEVASLIVDSASSRHESRGLHYTLDYPDRLPDEQATDTRLQRI